MYIVIIVTLIAIFLTYQETRGQLNNGMFLGGVLVTLLGCIHYNYGNDYMAYYGWYQEFTTIPFHWDNFVNGVYRQEPGWVILNYLFEPIGGFFMMVAVLNIIQNAIYYHFIKENVRKSKWTIAVSIYLMSTSLYILNFSMMRQGLAISLFVLAWSFIKRKKLIPSLLIIGIASTIHYSAQILFPFALLPFIPLNKKVISSISIVLILALYLSSNFLSTVFNTFATMEELNSTELLEYYQNQNLTTVTYGVGFVINLLPFIIAAWALFTKDELINDEKKVLVVFSLFYYIVASFAQILQLLGRFGMYFTAINIAAIPFVYSLLPQKVIYRTLMGVYIFMLLYDYFLFFHSEVWMKSYSTFHTIFEVL